MNKLYADWVLPGVGALALGLASAGASRAQQATFASPMTYPVGNNIGPSGIAVADVNGDGRPDLLTANYISTAGVLLGNGNGTFQAATTYPTSGTSVGIAVADVNGDSRPDLLVANNDGTAGVLLGNGNGTFQMATTYATGAGTQGIAVADVNGDGRPDLLTAAYAGAWVLLGNGNGTFQAAKLYSTGANSSPTSIAVADVNKDGQLDLLTANSSGNTAGVLLGNGNGTFRAAATYVAGTFPTSIAVADVNGDGQLDLLTANTGSNTAGVLLGNGNGTFQAAATYNTTFGTRGIAVADVNGDGRPDLLTANEDVSTVGVLLGNGNGTFQTFTAYQLETKSEPVGIAAADVNGDGRPDLLTANIGRSTAAVLLNTTVFAPIVTAPVVITAAASNLATTSATLGGTLTAGSALTDYGVVYTPGTGLPTTSSVKVSAGTSTPPALPASFAATATGLLPGTTYTARAYATNSAGTSYGSSVTFTTVAAPTSLVAISRVGSSPTNAASLPYTVTFAAAVTGLSASNFALATTGSVAGASITALTGSGTTYTVLVSAGSGDGTLALSLANTTGLSSGLTNALPVLGQAYTLDTTSPTPTISSPAGASTTAAPIPFAVNFQEAVTGFAASSITVANGTVTAGSLSGSNGLYTFTVSPVASGGLVAVSLPAGAATDLAGNASRASSTYSLTYAVGPTVTTAAPGSPTATAAILGGSVTAEGGAAVYERGVVYSLGSANPAPAIGGAGVTQDSNGAGRGTYAKNITGLMPNTTYTARAYATNSAGTSYGSSVTFTTAAATVASIVRASSSPTNAGSVSYTVTFSTSVTGLTADNFSFVLSGLDPSGVRVTSVAGAGAAYVVTVSTGTGSGTLQLQLASAAGLTPAVAPLPFAGETYVLDRTAPTVAITSPASNPTTASLLPVVVQFSESVTGFTASSVSVRNGSVSDFTGSGASYAFNVTPTASGAVTVLVPANAATDAAGNGNTAATPLSVAYAPPAVASISVQYQTGDLGQPTDYQVRPFLQLVNNGSAAVPYQGLTVRYWLTVENFAPLVTPIDWAKLGTGFVSARYVPLATPRQGAYGYVEYSFAAGAGSLAAGSDSGPIYGKAYKQDYTSLDETNDWSYQTSSSFTSNDHLTVYQNGTLISGTEPPVLAAAAGLKVYAASQDASPTTAYLSVRLQAGNTGSQPVSYADLKVRYWLTPDGAQPLVYSVDYAKLGSQNFSLQTGQAGTQTYAELSFAGGLGTFYPASNTGDIFFKIRKADYSPFTQANDYSFSGAAALVEQPRITAYLNGQLVFGTEPEGAAATQRSEQLASATAAASSGQSSAAAAASTQLERRLTGSPNPFTDHLQLEFALPYTQAYTLAVYDGQGRLVRQLPGGTAPAGQLQQVALPAQDLAAGLYLVRLTTATDRQQLKFIKQ